ncbi:PREDICTED: HD domain-containing protein 2 homolog [Tarenaya hassleriana]|uniref:HD domain-containing protein 2 homolog n=1 Tax=Tarenaya hassleriana TaxID=28532 RepID=UPI00053C138B|nr:PREDICTED: HD domain-containing protein 2 homolog [Tarenaya hassleriana]
MCKVLGGGLRAEEIKELWQEYENNASLEANLVKDFDKVEMILQALEYEMEHGKVLDEFFISTAGKFQTGIGKSWAAEILSRRNQILEDKRK